MVIYKAGIKGEISSIIISSAYLGLQVSHVLDSISIVLGLIFFFNLSFGVSKGTLREIDPVEVNFRPLRSESFVF